ncbi:hypothetical protein BDR05DRAFT_957692, partial [Suillus weaverae]
MLVKFIDFSSQVYTSVACKGQPRHTLQSDLPLACGSNLGQGQQGTVHMRRPQSSSLSPVFRPLHHKGHLQATPLLWNRVNFA